MLTALGAGCGIDWIGDSDASGAKCFVSVSEVLDPNGLSAPKRVEARDPRIDLGAALFAAASHTREHQHSVAEVEEPLGPDPKVIEDLDPRFKYTAGARMPVMNGGVDLTSRLVPHDVGVQVVERELAFAESRIRPAKNFHVRRFLAFGHSLLESYGTVAWTS
jgi:hypothetical protein